MQADKGKYYKVLILAGLTAFTLAIHYGLILEPIFGHIHWFHALHGRFCYIPIAVAASWFGLRGGLLEAGIISLLVLPYILTTNFDNFEYVGEIVEILFYFFIAALVGALVEREYNARQKQQEAELQVERSQKLSLVGQIAAGVAHEIKNPLASIKGAADILTDEKTSLEDMREFRDILDSEVKRIDATVSEFLAFARPKETKREPVNFSEIVQASVKQLSTQARQQELTIESNLTGNIVVNGDISKLRQMVLNLLINAIQASQSGNVVTISLSVEKKSAKLQIIDTGTGIKEEDLKRAYEPFFTTKASGTGLGLAIVKSIVDNHDGTITIESKEHEGTTVTVIIPIIEKQEILE